jgi:hypothetical protein
MGWDLRSIIQDNAAVQEYYNQQIPVACPHDGQPLQLGPPSQPGVWYCPFGNFTYPDDYDPILHSGL